MKKFSILIVSLTFWGQYNVLQLTAQNAFIPDFQVNDGEGLSVEHFPHPAIALDQNGNFIIAWDDSRNGHTDIYAQRYASNGTALGSNFKVNDDESDTLQEFPSIGIDGSGNFILVWVDKRNINSNIYAQRYLSSGMPIGSNFKVNDNQDYTIDFSANIITPGIAVDSIGNFVITWTDGRDHANIFAQIYLGDGTPVGRNFKVNDDEGLSFQVTPSITSHRSGNFFIAWNDDRNAEWNIYAQGYFKDGTPMGTNLRITNDVGGTIAPAIGVDENENFIITWADNRNGNLDIYAQLYLRNGTSLGSDFKVNDDEGSELQIYPSTSIDQSGNFTIVWIDTRNSNPGTDTLETDIYAQRYLSDGTALGRNFRVTNIDKEDQMFPDVIHRNNRIYSTWADSRVDGIHLDIWANVLDWTNPTAVIDNELPKIPQGLVLHQNYPNPFNPSTQIEYSIPQASRVVLKIYNLYGQEIRTLVDEQQAPGIYRVIWDGRRETGRVISSGIYFAKIVAGNYQRSIRLVFLR